MAAAPYVNQTLTPIPGAPSILTAPPIILPSDGPPTATLVFGMITIPSTDVGRPTATLSGAAGTTILVRDGDGNFVVKSVPSSVTPSSSPSGPRQAPVTGQQNTGVSPTSTPPITGADASDLSAGGVPTGAHIGASTSGSTSKSTGKPAPTSGPGKGTDSNYTAAAAAAGAMGGLFAITLVALLFLLFKLKKARKDSFHPQPMVAFTEAGSEKDQSPISELSATNTNLMSQLEERNAQLSTLQATLMRSNSVPPSLDDRSVASRFKQVEQELKDWVIIHFKSTEQRLDLSPQLREILISQVPLFDRLLQQPKSRTMVLRAVAGHVIQKAFENGEFVGAGEGLGSLERSVGRIIPETEFNKWRSQTFLMFSKASTTESRAHVVATISQRIDSLLSPFSTTPDQQERLLFLYRIVESAATLSLDLGCQLAKFKVLSDPAEAPFNGAHMEDVYQEHETQVNPHTGMSVNALDGKSIQAVVFPSVIKWGDERGENYEETKVILKAKVLT